MRWLVRAGRNRVRVTVLVGPVEVAHVGRPLPSHSGTALKWLATASNRRHHAARLLDEALNSDLARAHGRPAEAQADEDRLALGRLCSFAAQPNMLQHSPTCCSIVHLVATWCNMLQPSATHCNTVHHLTGSACARPAESNSGDRCSLRECAEHHALLQVVFMRGGQQAGMGGLGAGAGACSVRVARARVGCVGAKAPCG